jgi:ADP-ribosylglycohydrolase
MFKGIIIGDAYGAGFEFNESMPTNMASDGSGNSLRSGQYTDDTQMSIAVAETLLGGDYSKLAFATKFTEVFHRDPRVGYAKGFYNFLLSHIQVVQNYLPELVNRQLLQIPQIYDQV